MLVSSRKTQRGFNLIELLIVIGIIAIGLIFIFSRGQTSRTDNQANNVQSDLAVLVTAVPKARQSGDYTAITAAELCRHLPELMCPSGVITHSGGGTATPSATTVNSLSHTQFAVTNLSAKACSSAFASLHPQMSEISVGSSVVKSTSVAFTEAALNAACSAPSQSVTFSTRG